MLVGVVERHVGDDARSAGQGAGGGDRVAQHHRRLPRERHRDAVFGKHLDGGAHDGVDEDAAVAEAVGGRRGRAEFLHVGSGGAGDVGNRAAVALDEVRIIVRRRVAHDDVAALHTGGVERIFERRGLVEDFNVNVGIDPHEFDELINHEARNETRLGADPDRALHDVEVLEEEALEACVLGEQLPDAQVDLLAERR